jgi:hypothetical protein
VRLTRWVVPVSVGRWDIGTVISIQMVEMCLEI